MYKNIALQKVYIYEYDTENEAGKTNDAGNISGYISLDNGSLNALNTSTPTEVDSTDAPGLYYFDLTQSETNADHILIVAKTTTSDVHIEPVSIYTYDASNVLSIKTTVESIETTINRNTHYPNG